MALLTAVEIHKIIADYCEKNQILHPRIAEFDSEKVIVNHEIYIDRYSRLSSMVESTIYFKDCE